MTAAEIKVLQDQIEEERKRNEHYKYKLKKLDELKQENLKLKSELESNRKETAWYKKYSVEANVTIIELKNMILRLTEGGKNGLQENDNRETQRLEGRAGCASKYTGENCSA